MNVLKVLGFLLVLGGALGLAYGGFSMMQTTHEAAIGPLQLQFNETRQVAIPMWLSLAAVAAGVMMLVVRR